ncbi:class I SAM-dependent DNA methyltransferase [Desulfobacter curvatus]|uniref:class I SAM-dependent DNA methyltransferase n=1 Tax=Desulfobacter curvatus TaxID=2290 RepID=UPI0003717374|nr:class I SAM-dependent methyltransferase [Desulfobacter curvatus]
MTTVRNVFNSDHVTNYDKNAEKVTWLDPAIIFGMAYRFVEPGDLLLDIGIGTGLSSQLFYKAGLEIYGIDFSPKMLARCRSKQMAKDLKEHDLSITPYPFGADSMDHAVCTGVTHLFKDLAPIFQELGRILKPGGIFAFVVPDCRKGEPREIQVDARHSPGEKVTIFSYSGQRINTLLELYGFVRIFDLTFEASAIGHRTAQYKAYVVQKTKNN